MTPKLHPFDAPSDPRGVKPDLKINETCSKMPKVLRKMRGVSSQGILENMTIVSSLGSLAEMFGSFVARELLAKNNGSAVTRIPLRIWGVFVIRGTGSICERFPTRLISKNWG